MSKPGIYAYVATRPRNPDDSHICDFDSEPDAEEALEELPAMVADFCQVDDDDEEDPEEEEW